MRLAFNLFGADVTVVDTNTTNYDCSDLSDEELAELVNPRLAGEKAWEPQSQSAFEEAYERGLYRPGEKL
jgi:hypothetical protein